MRWISGSKLASIVVLVALLIATGPASGFDPYTNRDARYAAFLDDARVKLDLGPLSGGSSSLQPREELAALLSELEAQSRGLPHPGGGGGEVDDADANTILAAQLAEIYDTIGGTVLDPQPSQVTAGGAHPWMDAGLLAASILLRFPDASPNDESGDGWSASTLESARVLFKWGNWPYLPAIKPGASANPLGNNLGSNLAMRLLAAEIFDDEEMMQRVRYEYAHARAILARRGLAEAHAPHYAGRVIRQLALARQTGDPTLRKWIDDMLEMHLVAAAHTYLPGGGIGAPQQRDKTTGGISDPSPASNPSHLINAINMLIYDPALEAKLPPPGDPQFKNTYSAWLLASDYVAPELIRSLYLDKGSGYEYRYRSVNPWDVREECPPPERTWLGPQDYGCGRSYESTGWQGWNPSDYLGNVADPNRPSDPDGSTHIRMQPAYATMLASGKASIGGAYGYHGITTQSWGAYVENPNTLWGFSILYQHQPRDEDRDGTAWDPLTDDPNWIYERKTPYRRMGFARTQMALYDVAYEATTTETGPEDPNLEYTIAHVPAFMSQCAGSDWWVGQPASGLPYLAYRPLGAWTSQAITDQDETTEDFTLVTLTDPISGYVAEIAEDSEYVNEAAYCANLNTRSLSFTGGDAASAVVGLSAADAQGTMHAIELEFEPETRRIDGNDQSDVDSFGSGVVESPWATWSETEVISNDPLVTKPQFNLRISRAPYADRVLEFGDPTSPLPAERFWYNPNREPDEPVVLSWDHSWHDTGDDHYEVLRNGDMLASVAATTSPRMAYVDDDLCTQAYTLAGVTDVAKYAIRTADVEGNPPTFDPDDRAIPLDTYVTKEAPVNGDVTRPTPPSSLNHLITSEGEVFLWWAGATDNWGIYAYWVRRTDQATGQVVTHGTNATWWADADVEPGKTYEYTIQTIDKCPRLSDETPPLVVTVP